MNIREIQPSIRRKVIVNRGERPPASERAIAKGRAAAFANSKPAQGLRVRPIRESERNCCRRNYASHAFCLFLSEGAPPLPHRIGTGVTRADASLIRRS